jgi:hypothetical protein
MKIQITKMYPSKTKYILKATVRNKAISGSEVSRMLRLPDFKTVRT